MDANTPKDEKSRIAKKAARTKARNKISRKLFGKDFREISIAKKQRVDLELKKEKPQRTKQKKLSNRTGKTFEELSKSANKAVRSRRLNIISRRKFDQEYKELDFKQKRIVEIEFEKDFPAFQESIIEKLSNEISPSNKTMVTEVIATMITKWSIKKIGVQPTWQLLEFKGKKNRESAGIIDILAVRKDHRKEPNEKMALSRGDLLQVILIQVKGGSAKLPSIDDIERLQILAKYYHAKNIMLSEWKKHEPIFYLLKEGKELKKILKKKIEHPKDVWIQTNPQRIFGK